MWFGPAAKRVRCSSPFPPQSGSWVACSAIHVISHAYPGVAFETSVPLLPVARV